MEITICPRLRGHSECKIWLTGWASVRAMESVWLARSKSPMGHIWPSCVCFRLLFHWREDLRDEDELVWEMKAHLCIRAVHNHFSELFYETTEDCSVSSAVCGQLLTRTNNSPLCLHEEHLFSQAVSMTALLVGHPLWARLKNLSVC